MSSRTVRARIAIVCVVLGTNAAMAVQALADCQPEFQRPGDIVICTLIDPDGFRNQSPEVVDDPDAPPPDDITVNVAEGATVITDSGGIVLTGVGHEVNNRGTVTGEQSGVLIGGAGSVVNNEGVISTGGDGAEGIGVAGTTVISNTGEIATAGNESEGIGVLGAGSVVTSAGSIETMGDESEGIGVEGDGAFVTHSGSLRTRGDESEGIGVEGAGANVGNTGSIRTGGALSSGISMEGSGVLATNTGTIETAGRLSVGMGMDATGGELINNGSADTGGELAPGMFAVGSDNTLDNIGSIATAGGNAAGIQVGVDEIAFLPSDDNTVHNSCDIATAEVAVDESPELVGTGFFGFSEDATLDASVMELDNNSSLFVENRADAGQLFLTESLVQIAESSTLSANFVDVGGDSEIELDGTLRTIRMDVDSGGEVCGDGRLIAPILNAEEGSRVKPGCSFGSLTVEGVFDMAGVLEIEIGAGDFDQLIVLGELNFLLGAEILFEFQDFAPMDGEFFDFLIADAITGFDSLTFGFSGLDGSGFDVALGENGLQLMVSESVPEPPMLLLLCGGLLGMALPRFLGRGTA